VEHYYGGPAVSDTDGGGGEQTAVRVPETPGRWFSFRLHHLRLLKHMLHAASSRPSARAPESQLREHAPIG
jgi:hypothetical protein